MRKLLLIIIGIFLITSILYAQDTEQYITLKTDNYNVNVQSPLTMNLETDYTITPESIQIRDGEEVSIVGGQSLVSKYVFVNRLDYDVIGRYELDIGIRDSTQLKKIGVYVAEALPEVDCVKKGGEILKYNGNRIAITNNTDSKELYLCYVMKTTGYTFESGKLTLDMIIEPGNNDRYILFVTSPTLSLEDEKFIFEDTIKIKEITDKGPDTLITTATPKNSDDLKDIDAYNNQVTYPRANSNYNTREVTTGEKVAEASNQTSSQEEGLIKSKAVGLLTLTSKNALIVGAGILAIIVLALIMYSRKSKDLSDVN